MNLLKSLGEYLKSQPIITDSVSERIYRDTLKSSGISMPYIIYKCLNNKIENNFGAKKVSEVEIKVVGEYENQDEVELIRENIKNLLVGKCGILTEDWHGKITFNAEEDNYSTELRQAVRGLTLNFLEF